MHNKIYLPLLWDPTPAGTSPACCQPVMNCGGVKSGRLWAVKESSLAVMLVSIPTPPISDWHSAQQGPAAHCSGARAPLDARSALQMQKYPANISRHFIMYFTLFLLFCEAVCP